VSAREHDAEPSSTRATQPRSSWWLILTMLTGAACLFVGLADGGSEPMPAGGLVAVNGVVLPAQDVAERISPAVRTDGSIDHEEAKRLLEEVVLEEIVFQQGVRLGLARSDGLLRGRVLQVMRDFATSEARVAQPSDEQLRDYYEQHRRSFLGDSQARVTELFLPGAASKATAERIHQQLAQGADFDALRTAHSQAPPYDYSLRLHRIGAIEAAMGKGYGRAVRATAIGRTSPPLRSRHGYHIVRIDERKLGAPLAFEQARQAVLIRYRRQASREALDRYLKEAREQADVQVAADAVQRLLVALDSPAAKRADRKAM